jgi:photosystem II stability/assembly factor-like uncharacterized protein
MKKRRIDFVILLSLSLILFLSSNVLAMKLLTPKIGWTATGKNLYWTIDGGSTWKNITPPSVSFGQITSIFFLNTTQGWVLCNRNEDKYKEFFVAYTNDSGATWTSWPIKLPDKYISIDKNNRKMNPFSEIGWIYFLDANNGWIVLEFPISAKMDNSMGIMLKTEDGGKTFKMVADHSQLPTTGECYFITAQDGWLEGHINSSLYVTHNGGITWKEVSLEPPPQILENCWYDLPVFKDSQHGFLPVTYVSQVVALFITNDGGKTWKVDRILPDVTVVVQNIASAMPSNIVDSILINLTASDSERTLTLIKVLPGGKTIVSTTDALNIKGNLTPRSLYFGGGWHLTFITPDQGWVSTYTNQLLSTNDGGKTWTVITPQ